MMAIFSNYIKQRIKKILILNKLILALLLTLHIKLGKVFLVVTR